SPSPPSHARLGATSGAGGAARAGGTRGCGRNLRKMGGSPHDQTTGSAYRRRSPRRKDRAMPKGSRTKADKIEDHGIVVDRSCEVDGYTINFVTFNEAQDITGLLATLSQGKCMCPHMGYVVSGKVGVRYDDGREEVVEAGEAFYMPAGHTSWRCD